MSKPCTKCGETKPLTEFHKQSSTGDGRRSYCKECAKVMRASYLSDPATKQRILQRNRAGALARYHSAARRSVTLKRMYGITEEDYQRLLSRQGGVCAVCSNRNTGNRRLCVDHDHITGKVRGLLCHRCNQCLGKFDDSADLLLKASEYLSCQSPAHCCSTPISTPT